jgi:hypothetical protein
MTELLTEEELQALTDEEVCSRFWETMIPPITDPLTSSVNSPQAVYVEGHLQYAREATRRGIECETTFLH